MADPIRVLTLDHFSGQDRSALMDAGGDRFLWRVIPYWRLRDAANRWFPPEVQHGLAPYALPALDAERVRFTAWLRRELGRLFVEWPFDIVVLPSDVYYYVRALPELVHELGVPVVVVQKETTITDETMRRHAADVAAHAPFVSDWMTVCSERHKRFWVEAGADPSLIEVTGQPRFDIYAAPAAADWADVGLAAASRTVLFLSYEPDAYLLGEEDRREGWGLVRSETEAALIAAAARGWRIVVKPHPLQDWDAERRRFEASGARIELVSPDTDTRLLILLADAVVGFQTTALYEAMVAGKPIAYTAWSPLYERVQAQLIPFDERPDLLDVIRSPDELESWLHEPPEPSTETMARRRQFSEDMLGPMDGRASERTLAAIDRVADAWQDARRLSIRRRELRRRVTPAGVAAAVVAGARFAAWSAIDRLAAASVALVPNRPGRRARVAADFRRTAARDRLGVALAALSHRGVARSGD